MCSRTTKRSTKVCSAEKHLIFVRHELSLTTTIIILFLKAILFTRPLVKAVTTETLGFIRNIFAVDNVKMRSSFFHGKRSIC